jgi:hypothetical protein
MVATASLNSLCDSTSNLKLILFQAGLKAGLFFFV